MALKPVVSDLAEVPEAARSFYVPKDGKHVLDMEGDLAAKLAEANGKVVEFRDSKLALLKALGVASPEEGLAKAAKLAGLDVAEYERLKATAEKMGAKTPDDLDAKIQARIDAAVAPVVSDNKSLRSELDAAKTAAAEATRRSVVTAAFTKVGGKASAADFIVDRAKGVFDVEGGTLKPKADKFSANNPGQPLGLEEWLLGEAKEVPFLFELSNGGGAIGSASSGRSANATSYKTTSGAELKMDNIEVLA